MYRYVIILLVVLFITPTCFYARKDSDTAKGENLLNFNEDENKVEKLYQELGLSFYVTYNAFKQAYTGYKKINTKKDILTLIDFTKPSTKERMYVIDLRSKKLLFVTHVSHGKNSGENYATSFSNKCGSNQSSLGFYLTEGTYQGQNGLSLILNGLEKGINDKAKERAIVIHGAAYCNPSVTKSMGRLGRSLGCPALPLSISKEVINTIKDGSVLFIYADDAKYTQQSKILSSTNQLYAMNK